ncbi:mucin-22 [Eurytemora carolleeae]|uniref:mucin-22 n=1 Tax=Eurytemora carolleeae TaxID=1294199 RepID=UPI000C7703D0|nr:mucin-22 [Eurytemora carolleeae]|eukprot:XP_023336878.1 mucin-22-like [Eurytemora affinis]
MPVKKMTDMDENKTNTKKSDFTIDKPSLESDFTIDKPSLESDFTIDKPSLESDHLIFTVLADIVNEDNLTIKNTSLSHKNNELTPDRIQLSEPLVNLTSLEYEEELLQEPAKQVDQTTEEGENDLKAHLRPNEDINQREQTTPPNTTKNSVTSFILSTFQDVAATSTTIKDEAATSTTIKDKAENSTTIENLTSTATTIKDVAATATTIESVASTATTIESVVSTATTIEDEEATVTTTEDEAATETTVGNVAATATTLNDVTASAIVATTTTIKDVAATTTAFEDVVATRTILKNVASDKIQESSTPFIFENIESFDNPDASATISESPTSNVKNVANTFKAVTFKSKIAGFTTEASTQIGQFTTEAASIKTKTVTSIQEKVPSTIEIEPSTIEIEPSTIEIEASTIEIEASTIEIEASTTKNILSNPEKATISSKNTALEAKRQITSKTPMNVEIFTTERETIAVNDEAPTTKIETFTNVFEVTTDKSERIKSFGGNLDSNSKNKIPTNRKGLFDTNTEISANEKARPVTATTVSSSNKEELKDKKTVHHPFKMRNVRQKIEYLLRKMDILQENLLNH